MKHNRNDPLVLKDATVRPKLTLQQVKRWNPAHLVKISPGQMSDLLDGMTTANAEVMAGRKLVTPEGMEPLTFYVGELIEFLNALAEGRAKISEAAEAARVGHVVSGVK